MKKTDLVLGLIGVVGLGVGGMLFANRARASDASTAQTGASAGASSSDYTSANYANWAGEQPQMAVPSPTPTNGVVVNTGAGFFDNMIMKVTNFLEPRGVRNNNPGNLVITRDQWIGKVPVDKNTDGVFEQFYEPKWGLRALFIDMRGDIEKRGQNTIRKLITAYAPPSENNTQAYINSVVYQVGLGADSPLLPVHYMKLMKAIIQHENGKQPYSDALLQEAMQAAG